MHGHCAFERTPLHAEVTPTHQTQLPHAVQVRFVQVEAIKRQLDANHIVLLSNLAYSAAGEVLNCDIYSVATRAAVDLQVSPGAVL